MKPKPDNRSDNCDNIQHNIKMTKENIQRANDIKDSTPDKQMKQTLEDKNERREEAVKSMQRELEDEADYRG